MMVRKSARAVAPLLYAAGFALVMLGAIAAVTLAERTIGFYDQSGTPNLTTIRYNGDVAGAVAVLLLGGVVFGLIARALVWMEGLCGSTLEDHLRHCTAHYVVLVALAILLLATYENQAANGMSLGYGVGVAALMTVGYAIVIDALTLWWQRRKHARPSLGAGT